MEENPHIDFFEEYIKKERVLRGESTRTDVFSKVQRTRIALSVEECIQIELLGMNIKRTSIAFLGKEFKRIFWVT